MTNRLLPRARFCHTPAAAAVAQAEEMEVDDEKRPRRRTKLLVLAAALTLAAVGLGVGLGLGLQQKAAAAGSSTLSLESCDLGGCTAADFVGATGVFIGADAQAAAAGRRRLAQSSSDSLDPEYGTCYIKKPDGTKVKLRIKKADLKMEMQDVCKDALDAGDGVVAVLTRNASLNMLISSKTGKVTTISKLSEDVFWDRVFFAAGNLYSVVPFPERQGVATYARGDLGTHRYLGYLVRTSLSIPPTTEVLTPAEQFMSTVQAATAAGDVVYSWRANVAARPDNSSNPMWWYMRTRTGVTLNLNKLARTFVGTLGLNVVAPNPDYILVSMAVSPRANELVLAVGVAAKFGNIYLLRATVTSAGDAFDFGYLGALITTNPGGYFDLLKLDNANAGASYMSKDRNTLFVVLSSEPTTTKYYDIWRVDISPSASATSTTTSVGSSIFGGNQPMTTSSDNTLFRSAAFSGASGDYALLLVKEKNPNYAATPALPGACIVSADLVRLSTATIQRAVFTVSAAQQAEACTMNTRVSEDGRLVFYFRVFPAAPRTRQWYRLDLSTGVTSGPQTSRFTDDQTNGIKL